MLKPDLEAIKRRLKYHLKVPPGSLVMPAVLMDSAQDCKALLDRINRLQAVVDACRKRSYVMPAAVLDALAKLDEE